MPRLSSEQFLSELVGLFEKAREKESSRVCITVKNLTSVPKPKSKRSKSKNPGMRVPIEETQGVPACLYRATLGTKKISTVVRVDEIEDFSEEYATLLRANMNALKKKDRKRRKKNTATKSE
ncbi:hypothetical protein PTSG_02280 [Salpingoeca rosetta]|uniref:Signal recognition particle 14 kDa protein n=1 Tax=Salpingoeca rosetta (strain ATCC 50818 / BSB-021) TaxID=946362 RepID=F2U1R3_SALR5|nr:uncharacterized protein PTSG_02280 [Salpingoeca rosetta]EGD81565.1 hypothetical protein PTSG_02280 [Salpingoeca rosetta]|eukprot:XP_004996769.1 hypothetical protein PTSG_02280 [Salpingoeca rosetta]